METIILEGRRMFDKNCLNRILLLLLQLFLSLFQITLKKIKNQNIYSKCFCKKLFFLMCASLYLQSCLVLISKTTCTAVVSVMKKEQSHRFHGLAKIFLPNPTLPYKSSFSLVKTCQNHMKNFDLEIVERWSCLNFVAKYLTKD